MARTTKLEPPYPGWKLDSKSRSWYDPSYGSFSNAKSFDPPTPGHPSGNLEGDERIWISRRQYDIEFYWVPIIQKGKDTEWKTHNFQTSSQMQQKIDSLPKDTPIMVRGYGNVSDTSPSLRGEPVTAYRTLYDRSFAHTFNRQHLNLSVFDTLDHFILVVKGNV